MKLLQRLVANLLKEVETKITWHLNRAVAESEDMIKCQVTLEGGELRISCLHVYTCNADYHIIRVVISNNTH